MKRITKMKNISMTVIGIIIFVLLASSIVKAEEDTYYVFKDSNTNSGVRGTFHPYRIDETNDVWAFCIHHVARYDSAITKDQYEKYKVGDTYGRYCSSGNESTPPWSSDPILDEEGNDTGLEPGSYMKYTQIGPIDAAEHQDAAYILAEKPKTDTGTYNDDTQHAIWATAINSGNSVEANALANEAFQFKQFHLSIHGGSAKGADIYSSLITGQTGNVRVFVDQNADTYTVGPFQVSYPNGQYNGQNKFSWITGITAITDVGNFPVTVLDNTGNTITGLGQNGNNTLNGKPFYIKFNSTTATKLKLQIDFGYLESCSAEMYAYKGEQWRRLWEKVFVSNTCVDTLGGTHNHGTVHTNLDKDGNHVPCKHGEIEYQNCPEKQQYSVYEWKLKADEYVRDTQSIMHVFSANKNYKTASTVIPTGYDVDLTMKIEGYVFLDQDQGKVNTGNNLLDGGEGLGGIEVSLYDSDNNLIGIKLTGSDGKYSFTGLNSQKKYYVQFVYNGMLYTNVQCANLDLNPTNGSKATEDAQGHGGNRQAFNSKFAEIGSFPNNYGSGRIAYKQEEIASLFKSIASRVVSNGGSEVTSSSDPKEQFAIDCRIKAYTVKKYPLIDEFVIDDKPAVIAGKTYEPIYFGKYDQLHVNLGIKARPTVDFALSKDVLNAQVIINEKTETYEYDSRTATSAFKVGIREEDYLNGLRGMYIAGTGFTNTEMIGDLDSAGTYDLNMRSEEITNNQIGKYNAVDAGKVNGLYEVSEDYNLNDSDKLKMFVTYKLAIKNQSSVSGSITEIVDYYDTNYKFVEAYVGDSKGNFKANVGSSTNSKYGANSQYKSSRGAYNTIYLTPPEMTLSRTDGVDNTDQYIYVKFELIDSEVLLTQKLINNKDTLNIMNLAEINGYKTSEGLIDIDSNPGNFNISNIPELTYQNIKDSGAIYEDDTSRAPTLIYKLSDSRTIEGVVFEDGTVVKDNTKDYNGQLDKNEKGINGVIVQLVEIKDGQMIVRATTKTKKNPNTNQDGWYGFTGFVPGDYTIRYIYGADDDTAMANNSQYIKGLNEKSYNGQDYQSTTYNKSDLETQYYLTDSNLISRYEQNDKNKNSEEGIVPITKTTKIDRFNNNKYWYINNDGTSDARDDEFRVSQVQDYSKTEYGREITNHKVEVFKSHVNPQPNHINKDYNRELANELERRTYRYAYTPMVEIEVEYATQIVSGTKEDYSHHIKGVDFGIVERPKQELWIDEDIAKIKLTLANGTVIFDDVIKEGENLQWINNGDENDITDKNELVNVIMDEELINGAQIEITYNIRLQNRSQNNTGITHAKNILNYVSNNLNFDIEAGENKNYWEVVSKDEVQNDSKSTLVNNNGAVDLNTQSVILKAKKGSPLLSQLREGEMTGVVPLTLKKVLSAENSSDDLRYTNLTEIVEIVNEFGRYDKDATPGNQRTDLNPTEHDAAGATRYTDPEHKPDTEVVVTPPTGSNYNYYTYIIIGIELAAILLVGVIIVKKLLAKKQQ